LNFEQDRKQVLDVCLREVVLRGINNPLLIEMIEHTLQEHTLNNEHGMYSYFNKEASTNAFL